MTSPERWEVTQLIKSGVLDVKDYPDFDDETGQVQCHPNQDTCPPLRGHLCAEYLFE